jgi:hypothetical protein
LARESTDKIPVAEGCVNSGADSIHRPRSAFEDFTGFATGEARVRRRLGSRTIPEKIDSSNRPKINPLHRVGRGALTRPGLSG